MFGTLPCLIGLLSGPRSPTNGDIVLQFDVFILIFFVDYSLYQFRCEYLPLFIIILGCFTALNLAKDCYSYCDVFVLCFFSVFFVWLLTSVFIFLRFWFLLLLLYSFLTVFFLPAQHAFLIFLFKYQFLNCWVVNVIFSHLFLNSTTSCTSSSIVFFTFFQF